MRGLLGPGPGCRESWRPALCPFSAPSAALFCCVGSFLFFRFRFSHSHSHACACACRVPRPRALSSGPGHARASGGSAISYSYRLSTNIFSAQCASACNSEFVLSFIYRKEKRAQKKAPMVPAGGAATFFSDSHEAHTGRPWFSPRRAFAYPLLLVLAIHG